MSIKWLLRTYAMTSIKCLWHYDDQTCTCQLVHHHLLRNGTSNSICQQSVPHGKQHQRNGLPSACIFLSPSVSLVESGLVYMPMNMWGIEHQLLVVWEILKAGWSFNPPTLPKFFPFFSCFVGLVPQQLPPHIHVST